MCVIFKPTDCQSCQAVPDSPYKVDDLLTSYWYFQSVDQGGCVGDSTVKSNCTVTMAFCRMLPTDCKNSSFCVNNTIGTSHTTYSVGEFVLNKNPFTASKSGDGFIAQFDHGSKYTRKDNSTCPLQSEIHFLCNAAIKWTGTPGGKSALPLNALVNNSFTESTCKYEVTLQYDGACIPILPPLNPDNSLSVGSVLIIVFVVVVSTYFLFGCAFKFCYGFRGREVLPHSEFWVDLPVLIADGMVFTMKCGKTDMGRTYDGI